MTITCNYVYPKNLSLTVNCFTSSRRKCHKNGQMCLGYQKKFYVCNIQFSQVLFTFIHLWMKAPRIFFSFMGPWSGRWQSEIQHKFELCQTERHDQFWLQLLSTCDLHSYRNLYTTSAWFIPWHLDKLFSLVWVFKLDQNRRKSLLLETEVYIWSWHPKNPKQHVITLIFNLEWENINLNDCWDISTANQW